MDLVVQRLAGDPVEERPIEIVERKGLGHPDTICDALAEELSLALSRFYLEHAGAILHHNVDKVLLFGGSAEPRLGGGEVHEPIEITLCGRATAACNGTPVPIRDLAEDCARRWLGEHLHAFDADVHAVIHPKVRPGSSDLVELFDRQRRSGRWLANDTSCGVGYAPLSELERIVLLVEQALNAPARKREHPEVGEDIKVMGVRHGDSIRLTLGCAFVGRHLASLRDYHASKAAVRERAAEVARALTRRSVEVEVNTADAGESVFLTVTGTSAESGDDGEAGRGNRVNGLIAPYRPMTMESVAGKNPVTHVGKLYNVLASLVAEDLVEEISGAREASCHLVSQIGRPIDDPQIADVRLRCDDPAGLDPSRVEPVVRRRLERVDALWQDLTAGAIALDRWPLHA